MIIFVFIFFSYFFLYFFIIFFYFFVFIFFCLFKFINILFSIYNLFCKVIKYDLLIKLWDLFILKGDFIVLQAAIAIIILQQENILNLTINEILGLFNKIVDKNNIFLIMKKINIEEEFNNWKINCQLIKKRQLFFNE